MSVIHQALSLHTDPETSHGLMILLLSHPGGVNVTGYPSIVFTYPTVCRKNDPESVFPEATRYSPLLLVLPSSVELRRVIVPALPVVLKVSFSCFSQNTHCIRLSRLIPSSANDDCHIVPIPVVMMANTAMVEYIFFIVQME